MKKISLIFLIFFLLSMESMAQNINVERIGDSIVGTGQFGRDIDISSNGKVIISSSINYDGDSSNVGLIRVYQWVNNEWIQKGQDLTGSNNERLGKQIVLNGKGNVIMASTSMGYNEEQNVKIFEYVGGTWTQRGSNLKTSQSGSIDVSEDGNTVIIGRPRINLGSGDALVYTYYNNDWILKGDTITEGASQWSSFGHDVSINYNGDIIAVSDSNAGSARVFQYVNNEWSMIDSPLEMGCWGAAALDLNYTGDKVVVLNASGSGNCNKSIKSYNISNASITFEAEVAIDRWVTSIKLDSLGNRFSLGTKYDQLYYYGSDSFLVYELINNNWLGLDLEGLMSTPTNFNISIDGKHVIASDFSLNKVNVYEISNFSTELKEACDSFIWNGSTYFNSGQYTQTIQNQYLEDSTIYLDLTINESFNLDTTIVACDHYYWGDTVFYTTGDYFYNYTNVNGCDSIYNMDIRIAQSISRNDTIIYSVSNANFSDIDPQVYFIGTDSSNTVSSCDSIVYHYSKFEFTENVYTDSNIINDTVLIYDTIIVLDTFIVDIMDTITFIDTSELLISVEDTLNITLTISTGMDEVQDELKVWSDGSSVYFESVQGEGYSFDLVSITGSTVLDIDDTSSSNSISLNGISKGTYIASFTSLTDSNVSITKKIVIR